MTSTYNRSSFVCVGCQNSDKLADGRNVEHLTLPHIPDSMGCLWQSSLRTADVFPVKLKAKKLDALAG